MNCEGGEAIEIGRWRCEGGVHECIEDRDAICLGLDRREKDKQMWCARNLAWAEELMVLILHCIHQARRKRPMLVDKFILTRYFIQSTQKRQWYHHHGQGDGCLRHFSMRSILRFTGRSSKHSNINSAFMKKTTHETTRDHWWRRRVMGWKVEGLGDVRREDGHEKRQWTLWQ